MRLLLVIALLAFAPVLLAGDEVTPEQIADLKERIGHIDQWLASAEKNRSALERELAATERQISKLTRERHTLRQQTQQHQQRLSELEQEERTLAATLNRQRESLKRQIRAAWMDGDITAIKVLLNEVDPDQIARTMTYYEYLSKDTVKRLETFRASLQTLKQTRANVQEARVKLAQTESDLAKRQQQLSQSRKKREQTLAALKSDILSRKNERQELESDRQRLEKLLKEVQRAIADIPAPNESRPFHSLRKKLPWPVKGKVVSNYGERYANGKLKRNGLLIRTAEDAEIRAIHYGRVVFANWLRGFGLITIIDHGDGYMTLYGHSSSLFTTPGDWVTAGQPIALAGKTGGTETPALYFEVRHNGKPDNPRRWLTR